MVETARAAVLLLAVVAAAVRAAEVCGVETAPVTGRDEDICGVCVAWPVAAGRVGLDWGVEAGRKLEGVCMEVVAGRGETG